MVDQPRRVKADDLKPYQSFLVARLTPEAGPVHLVAEVLRDIEQVLGIGRDPALRLGTRVRPRTIDELSAGFFHYEELRPVSWAKHGPRDRLNQLVVVCVRRRHVAICLTDARRRPQVARAIGDERYRGLGRLEFVPAAHLNAALVKGVARTLWLSGTHRRTSLKADSKVLSGVDLRDALDPLDDQSYYFTAARSVPDGLDIRGAVGVAPEHSRVWAGVSPTWKDFLSGTSRLLLRLEQVTRPDPAPIPVVAIPVHEFGEVRDAFDVSIAPPELLSDDPSTESEARQHQERWSAKSDFKILSTDGSDAEVEVYLDGQRLGILRLRPNLSDPRRVSCFVEGTADSRSCQEEHHEALVLCQRPECITIRYDSGHTLSGGRIYAIRHRDMPFLNFAWETFDRFDVTKEKPSPLTEAGSQDSLFCWVVTHWHTGWLVCDDGSMEIADFIHVSLPEAPPCVTLIHVKGAGDRAPSRGLSVSKYEVVTGQAVKNLRWLDQELLIHGLKKGLAKRIGDLVWHNGSRTGREQLLRALDSIGTNYKRRVIVLQPHITRAAHDAARSNPRTPAGARLTQLDALLLGARRACLALGAELNVIGSA